MFWLAGCGGEKAALRHVDDLAEACTFLMESDNINLSPISCFLPPFINIGSGNEISIKDLAFMIKDIVGFQGDLHFDTSMPDGTMRKLLDINRMAKLAWTSKLSLKDGIKSTYKMYN